MHGMVNITLSPETYDIKLPRRPIVSTASYDSGRVCSNAICNGAQHSWRPLRVIRVTLSALQPFPLFTQFQTYRCAALSVAKCHSQSLGPHSISSSARLSIEGGTVRPSSLAALRFIISSNLAA
jgi:hypothetical protein